MQASVPSSSTYEQYDKDFFHELQQMADFEGEMEQTVSVIRSAQESAKLKILLDELDTLRRTVALGGGTVGVEVASKKPTVRGKKAAAPPASAAASVTADEVTEGGAFITADAKPKARRVTAYNKFVAHQVKVNKSSMKDAAAVWKTMDDEARAPFQQMANDENAASATQA